MSFSDRLNELLKKNKISAYKLCKDTGLSNSVVSDWRNAKSVPSIERAKIVADYFDVSVDFLLGKEDTTPSVSNNNAKDTSLTTAACFIDGMTYDDLTPEQLEKIKTFIEFVRSEDDD